MKDFNDKIAVVTGGGSGIGRALASQLSAAGCHIALCDINRANMEETRELCAASAPSGTRITLHECDVSVESQVQAFAEQVLAEHATDHINLLFNNAGIGGGGSFINGDRDEWERVFGVCWYGVYNCSRVFMPLVIASTEGHVVNVSSVNGFWASLGPQIAHTAYSAAKFAVKGFSEALLNDLRLNAPHVKLSVVMPGHIGTSIVSNSQQILGASNPLEMSADEVAVMRDTWSKMDVAAGQLTDEEVREIAHQRPQQFREGAPTTAAEAATIILDGVKAEQWRILVGEDAAGLDTRVRADPENAYEAEFFQKLIESGSFAGL